MAIKIFTGIPGSGKTYRVVFEMLKPEIKDKYFIIHNIPKLKTVLFGEYIRTYDPNENEFDFVPPAFFELSIQKELCDEIKKKFDRPVLFIIDECQTWLDKLDPKIKEWLSYHRHLGQDIWLVSQSIWNIHKDYKNLIEVEIQGKRGFIFKSFIYSWFIQGAHFKTDRIPKKKHIFKMYESFQIKGDDGKKSKMLMFIPIFVVITMVLAGLYIYKFKKNIHSMHPEKKTTKTEQKEEINQSKDEKPIKRLGCIGYIGKMPIVADQEGNVFEASEVIKGTQYIINKNQKNFSAIDSITGPEQIYSKSMINQLSGEARELAQAREQAGQRMRRQEIVIE